MSGRNRYSQLKERGRKKKEKSYSDEQLRKAIDPVISENFLERQAAVKEGVLHKTLSR